MNGPPRDAKARGRRAQAQDDAAGTPHRSAARDELQRLFATTAEPVAVVALRPDGRRVLFNHFGDRIAAEATVAALARVGLHAEVVVGIDSKTRPGTTIRPTP